MSEERKRGKIGANNRRRIAHCHGQKHLPSHTNAFLKGDPCDLSIICQKSSSQKTICYMRRFIRCWYAFTLTEYKTCNHWFFPDKSALQWFLLNSLHAELIFVNAATASGSVIFFGSGVLFSRKQQFFVCTKKCTILKCNIFDKYHICPHWRSQYQQSDRAVLVEQRLYKDINYCSFWSGIA